MATQSPPIRRARRTPLRRDQAWLLAGMLFLIVALAGFKSWRLYGATHALREDLGALQQSAAHADLATLGGLGPLLARTHADAEALRDEAAPFVPLTDRLGWVPSYGPDLAAAGALLDLAVDLSSAAEQAHSALQPLLQPPAGQSPTALLAGRMVEARPQLEGAQAALARASASLEQLPIDQLMPALRERLQRAASLVAAARDGLDLALALPELLGANGRHDYLLIAQNPDELRATGGLISGAGVLSFENGRLGESTITDAGALNNFAASAYPSAPEPLRRYMGLDLWGFQDSNWSPDLPTAARAISDIFRRGQGREVTDIIAIDPAGLQLLIGALGPLQVEGATQPISAANLQAYLRNSVLFSRPAGDPSAAQPWWVERKAFMAPLGRAIQNRLEGKSGPVDWLGVLGALRSALDERHLQIVVHQPAAAAVLAQRGWDGALRPGDADYLMLVDSNVGYNKVTAAMQHAITYTVDLSDPDNIRGELIVQQHNGAPALPQTGGKACDQTQGFNGIVAVRRYEDLIAGCSWDYLRVYTPGGSRLIASIGTPTPGAWLLSGKPDDGSATIALGDGGTNVIGTLVVTPPGQARRSFFRYQLPAAVLAGDERGWHYRLALQKQAGTPPLPTTIRLQLPDGATQVSANLPVASQDESDLTFTLTLGQDQVLEVDFQASF